jgi:DNA-3-methyladenine glycosylase II
MVYDSGMSATRIVSATDSTPPGPWSPRRALLHLRLADPKLGAVIERVGAYRFRRRDDGTHFDAVVRAIVYQQLSGRAAATIHGRLQALFGGRAPTAAELAGATEAALRSAGLSSQKLRYLKDLAARAASGALPIDTLHELHDDGVIEALTQVKGVGRWTAQMFLLFRLGRPDVLADTDLGIQKAVQRAYRLRAMPTPERVRRIGAPWSPYASVACWYLWRSLDGDGGATPTP